MFNVFFHRRMTKHTAMSPDIRNKNGLYAHVSTLSDLVPQTKSSPTTNWISSVDCTALPSPAPGSLAAKPSPYSVSMAILPHTVYSSSPANGPGLPGCFSAPGFCSELGSCGMLAAEPLSRHGACPRSAAHLLFYYLCILNTLFSCAACVTW